MLLTCVCSGVMEKLAQYYTSFVTEGSLVSRFDIPAIHGMVMVYMILPNVP